VAISAAMVWEVQPAPAGSDDNGGGFKTGASGTDRTYPASNPQAITDLKTDGATLTVMVSATYTFLASDVGNVVSVNVSDSGGLATVGRYEITSVTSGKATVDRAWASGNNGATAGATAVLGGALATPGQAGKTLSTASEGASSQKVFVKRGTYTLSTATAGSGGPFLNSSRLGICVEGYSSTRGDRAGRPVLDAGAQTNVILWQHSFANINYFVHLSADGQSGAGNKGFVVAYSGAKHIGCTAVDCSEASCYGFSTGRAIGCSATNCATGYTSTTFAIGCVASLCGVGYSGFSNAVNCLASGCTTDGFVSAIIATSLRCTADANGRYGFSLQVASECIDCLATNHSGAGDVGFYTADAFVSLINCAGHNNTTSASAAMLLNDGFVTLTADPYVSQATGDFRPNDTAGGGAALRAAGIGVYGQTDNRDIGAVQHTDPISGYTYGDEDPAYVLTTATGAGTLDLSLYTLTAGITWPALDAVDGGVTFGPVTGLEYEGTGMTSVEIEAAIAAALASGVNVTQIEGVDATDAIATAAAAGLGDGASLTEAGGTGDQLTEIPGLGSSGSGGNTIQFEITNGDGTLLENATVTLRLNDILKATGSTDATGRLSGTGLAVAATGTYELSVTCDGYNGHTADLVVTAGVNTMVEVELAGLSFPDSTEPNSVTVRWRVKKDDRTTAGAGEATVYMAIVSGPGTAGFARGDGFDSDTTDANGYVYFANVPVGSTVAVKLGTDSEVRNQAIPSTATSPYDGGELMGDV